MKRKLIDHLVNSGIVARDELQRCVLRAKMNRRSVVGEVVDRLEVDAEELAASMADFWGMNLMDRAMPQVDGERLEELGEDEVRDLGVLPVVADDGEGSHLVVYDVEFARPAVADIRREHGWSPTLSLATRDQIEGWLDEYIKRQKATREAIQAPKTRLAEVDPHTLDQAQGGDQPTRQVDLDRDNPFMELVAESASKTGEAQAVTSTAVGDGGEDDFFGDAGETAEVLESVSEATIKEPSEPEELPQEVSDTFDRAVDAFDAQLGDEISESPVMGSRSGVNWGDFEEPKNSFGERPPTAQPVRPDEATSPQSGLFRTEGSGRTGFEWAVDSAKEDMTLAELVEEQKKRIKKLEREVDYQKGVMQTLAALLVEARLLSGSKLKKRLREFRKSQQEKQD